MSTVRKIAPMTEAQMSERVKALPLGVRISPDRKSLTFTDGSHWVWDARFFEWTCTKVGQS